MKLFFRFNQNSAVVYPFLDHFNLDTNTAFLFPISIFLSPSVTMSETLIILTQSLHLLNSDSFVLEILFYFCSSSIIQFSLSLKIFG